MTIDEHTKELTAQAENDFGAAEALYKAGYYAHALFWAHLVLEKLCKALWVKNKRNVHYPYIHNLIKLLLESEVNLSDEQIVFYSDMNQFQAKGRYVAALITIETTITKNVCESYLDKTKFEMTWLKNQLQ